MHEVSLCRPVHKNPPCPAFRFAAKGFGIVSDFVDVRYGPHRMLQ